MIYAYMVGMCPYNLLYYKYLLFEYLLTPCS